MLYIYVLQLQNDKYYVGKTSHPHSRIETHFTNNGSEWTKLHKPIKLLELIPNCDHYDEDKYTYKYMDKFGIDNVRGGSYSTPVLDDCTINQLIKISNSVNNRCYTCGKSGHYANYCDSCDSGDKGDSIATNKVLCGCNIDDGYTLLCQTSLTIPSIKPKDGKDIN
jgi:cellular nucleic acid-binding protein